MNTALLYAGVEQMLEPAEMSQLLGRRVETVDTSAVEGLPGTTGAEFLAVSLDEEPEPSLMLKHVHATTDWVALLTRDEQRRAVRLWSEGVFDRMPGAVDPAVLACGEWEDGYGILMPHLGSEMLEVYVPLPAWIDDTILDAMAAIHAAYWEDGRLADPSLGLCTIDAQVRNISPRRAREVYGDELGWVSWIVEGWEEVLPQLIDPGQARDLLTLVDDPAPIAAALAPYPRTLVHGDIRPVNVGMSGDEQGALCHFVDWGRSAFAAPAVDLGFYLGFTAREWQTSMDERITTYEARLKAHLDGRWPADTWERQRELGLLAGLLQSNLGCMAYWGVRWATAEGDLEYAQLELAALRAWAARLGPTLDLL